MIKFKDKSINFSSWHPEIKNKVKQFFKNPEIQKYIKENNFKDLILSIYNRADITEEKIISAIIEILIKSGADIFTTLDVIPKYFFYDTNIQSINIEPHIKVIGLESFENCLDLKEVNIKGDNLVVIERYAFGNCNNLEKINFPKSLQTIGKGAFEFCYSLHEINYAGTMQEIQNVKYSGNMKPLKFVDALTIFENDIIFHCVDGDIKYISPSVPTFGTEDIENWKILN